MYVEKCGRLHMWGLSLLLTIFSIHHLAWSRTCPQRPSRSCTCDRSSWGNTTCASCSGDPGHMRLWTATIKTEISPTLNLKCSHSSWLLHLSLHSSQVGILLILSNIFMSVTLSAMHSELHHIEDFSLIIRRSIEWTKSWQLKQSLRKLFTYESNVKWHYTKVFDE